MNGKLLLQIILSCLALCIVNEGAWKSVTLLENHARKT